MAETPGNTITNGPFNRQLRVRDAMADCLARKLNGDVAGAAAVAAINERLMPELGEQLRQLDLVLLARRTISAMPWVNAVVHQHAAGCC